MNEEQAAGTIGCLLFFFIFLHGKFLYDTLYIPL